MATMQLDVTFRNLDSSDALKDYAREKVERVTRHVDRPMEAHVVLFAERHEMHADIQIHVHQADLVLRGKARSDDLYAAVDAAADKIERQLHKYKSKLKDHKPSAHGMAPLKVRHGVFAPEGLVPELLVEDVAARSAAATAPAVALPTPPEPRVVRNTEFLAKPMSLHEAVMLMDLRNAQFYVFRNERTQDVNVIYRRDDGNIGLIEASRD